MLLLLILIKHIKQQMDGKQLNIFIDRLTNAIDSKDLVKLVISKKRQKSSDLNKIMVSLVTLNSGIKLKFVYTHNTKDITKNFDFSEGIDKIIHGLSNDFYNADLFTTTENISLISSKKGKIRLITNESTFYTIESLNHDKIKKRYIKAKDNIYLRELGITKPNGDVFHKKIDKFKQINRYIELLAPKLNELNFEDEIHIVDMGSGKGYLTFALYDYLTNRVSKDVYLTGVEYRAGLVNTCNEISKKANFNNLKFVQGTIEKTDLDRIDVLIALHACDTATDEAIYRGIKADASLIVCAPCCHKQVRMDMSIENELNQIVKHGILKERQAEILTDTLRAMIMEIHGYKTNIFEFISTEHTPKNLMIVGKKSKISDSKRSEYQKQLQSIKKLFGLKEHYLEKLLKS